MKCVLREKSLPTIKYTRQKENSKFYIFEISENSITLHQREHHTILSTMIFAIKSFIRPAVHEVTLGQVWVQIMIHIPFLPTSKY